MSSMLGGGGGGGGMSSLLGGGGGGGGSGMSSLLGAGMKLLGSRGTGGGGGGLGSLLGGLAQSSNSGGWRKQTPVLSSNEVTLALFWSFVCLSLPPKSSSPQVTSIQPHLRIPLIIYPTFSVDIDFYLQTLILLFCLSSPETTMRFLASELPSKVLIWKREPSIHRSAE